MGLLEVKHIIIVVKNILDGRKRPLDTVEERISEYEDIAVETNQNKREKNDWKKLNKASVSSRENLGSLSYQWREGKKNIWEDNGQKYHKYNENHKEVQQAPNTRNINNPTPKYIIVNCLKLLIQRKIF